MEKDAHANSNKKKAGVTILISGQADCRGTNIAKEKESLFITIDESITWRTITILEKASLP